MLMHPCVQCCTHLLKSSPYSCTLSYFTSGNAYSNFHSREMFSWQQNSAKCTVIKVCLLITYLFSLIMWLWASPYEAYMLNPIGLGMLALGTSQSMWFGSFKAHLTWIERCWVDRFTKRHFCTKCQVRFFCTCRPISSSTLVQNILLQFLLNDQRN